MIASIVRASIRYRGVIVTLAALLLIYGGYRLSHAGLDIFPEFAPKLTIVQTEAPGYSTEQVELLVTQPIESALAGLIGLQYIRSESIQGLSVVNVFFTEHTDVYRNRQLVSERLAGIGDRLPPGTGPPTPVPLASSSATVLTIGVTSGSMSLMALRDIVDWTLVPRILSVRGVADVNVFGGEVRELQIQVLPGRLERFGLALEEVVDAAARATGIHGSGFIENESQRLTLSVSGQPGTPDSLASVVLGQRGGANVTLGDVARVGFAPAPPVGAASIMKEPGIVMMVIGQYGANTLTVSRRIEQVIGDLEQLLSGQGVVLYPDLFRPANYIETSLANLSGHLLVGGILVVIVLFLFLYNLRTAFISAIAIPLSLLGAAVILLESGVNLNLMVLGGLAIALGEVVDDAIIDTENIFRRLRENRLGATPRSPGAIVFDASMEVRGSVVYATFIVALVFVPLLMLSGVAGRLFAPLGFTYILAILMSLLVALTVTPALCYSLLGRGRLPARDAPLIGALKPRYGAVLEKMCRRPGAAIGVALLLSGLGLAVLPALETKFLPELREGHYIVHTTGMPGTSLEESIRVGNQLTDAFLGVPGVRSVSQWAGRAERGADTYGSHYSEYEVDLEPMPGSGQQRVIDELREILRGFPGLLFEANTFLIERIDETISGYTSPVVVNVFGNELDILDRQAEEIAAVMRSIPGAADVQVRSPTGAPLLQIRLKLRELAFRGLRPRDVIDAVQVAYEGARVSSVAQGNRMYDVSVMLAAEHRRNPRQIGALPLRTPEGRMIHLSDVAEITQTGGRYNILRIGAQRVQTVTCSVTGRGLDAFMRELRSKILSEVGFGPDAALEFTGAAVEQARARQELILYSLLAGAVALLLIYVAIGSARHTLLLLLNLPFSLVGGVIAVLLTGGTLSVGSVVGFVTLFGITVRNSIMLVSHYRHLVDSEGCAWNAGTAIRGAQERLPSILMTALVTMLAMLPIALDSDNPGREIMGPMAAIIIGGLASSTLLNLLIMPTVILKFGRFEGRTEA
ncbi:MAG: efflux RND transporter permease subunit [Gammaproteobacteria bacterium]|nr:efflux RND transporter permease subunit [Gammaproteobacteria bacterium]